MSTMLYKLVLLLLLTTFCLAEMIPAPVVTLPNGDIEGRVLTTYSGVEFYAYEKIPYALPPIGNLRFQPPQPPENWTGTLNTTVLDVICIQIGGMPKPDSTESENCLYLNVFRPKNINGTAAVMAYIHGGGFMSGAAIDYRPDMFINWYTILVTINYRLGPFGFTSTHDEVIPGNNGLKDQLLALQWVKNNIHLFQGDPERITIFGQSAGAGSCAYHLLNPKAEGLFQRVILESGTFLSPGMLQRNPRTIAFGLASMLNSDFESNESSQDLLDFLNSVSADDIKKGAELYNGKVAQSWGRIVDQGSMWAPVLELKNPDAFITKKMYMLLEAGNILPVPTMMDFTSEESLLGNQDPDNVASIAQLLDNNLELIVPNDMKISKFEDLLITGSQIRNIYTNGTQFFEHLGGLIRFSSDNTETRAKLKHAQLFSKLAKTYFYQFSYDGILGNIDVHYDGAEAVGHTEELNYIFCGGDNCNDSKYPQKDLEMRQILVQLWTNFAKYEDPTYQNQILNETITWSPLSAKSTDFLYLDIGDSLEVKSWPKKEYYDKWLVLYNSLNYTDFDTF